TELPFVPRERLMKHQQYFQHVHRHTYLKGRFDKITSVAIPLALAGSCLALIGRGVYNMSYGFGKKALTGLSLTDVLSPTVSNMAWKGLW
ncbi:unnamed protein product, partial [Musa textilis]